MVATITPAVTKVTSSGDLDAYIVEWAGVAALDVCLPYAGPGWADRNVHLLGTLGAGFHLKFDGSNAGTPNTVPPVLPADAEYSPLTEAGTVIDMTAVGFHIFDVVPLFTRPVVTGDGTTSVTIRMLVRRTK